MAANFRTPDRDQIFLMPPRLDEWIQEDDIVHFIIEAAGLVPMGDFQINHKGTGKAQYHPQMMLALLLYSYSHGLFSSRKIERSTYNQISVRYLCGNLHPDHDTICTFRRCNEKAIKSAFLHVLKLAKELGILKIGTVSTDGTLIKANASIHNSIRYDRAFELELQLTSEISQLMDKAEKADKNDEDDNDELKGDLKRLTTLKEKVKKAQEKLEEQERTEPDNQVNMTDSESRIMRKNNRSEYTQSYNAQAVVDAEGSQLVVGARVTNAGVDRKELAANVESIPAEIGTPDKILADNGYVSKEQVTLVEEKNIDVFLPVTCEGKYDERKHDFRPQKPLKKKAKNTLPWIKNMAAKMEDKAARDLYRLRKQTVEPVFGIVKEAMGFRQFHLRGIDKVNNEWLLLMSAYNLKRLANLVK